MANDTSRGLTVPGHVFFDKELGQEADRLLQRLDEEHRARLTKSRRLNIYLPFVLAVLASFITGSPPIFVLGVIAVSTWYIFALPEILKQILRLREAEFQYSHVPALIETDKNRRALHQRSLAEELAERRRLRAHYLALAGQEGGRIAELESLALPPYRDNKPTP